MKQPSVLTTLSVTLLLALAGCSSGTTVTAMFDDVSGLETGAKVLVAGVEVGSVKTISVVDGHAQVVMEIDQGQEVTLHEAACAHIDASGVTLHTGDDGDFDEDIVPACTATLVERALELQNQLTKRATQNARQVGRELGMTAAEFSRGLNDSADDLRETGRNLSMAGRAFAEGAEEGSR